MSNEKPVEKQTLVRPDYRIEVTYSLPNEEVPTKKELFMSAGLENRIVNVAQQMGDLTALWTSPIMREIILIHCLMPRGARGKEALAGVTLDDFQMSAEEADKVMEWATLHITHFFANAVQKIQNAAELETGALKTLMVSLNGLTALVGKKDSLGATDAE